MSSHRTQTHSSWPTHITHRRSYRWPWRWTWCAWTCATPSERDRRTLVPSTPVGHHFCRSGTVWRPSLGSCTRWRARMSPQGNGSAVRCGSQLLWLPRGWYSLLQRRCSHLGICAVTLGRFQTWISFLGLSLCLYAVVRPRNSLVFYAV